MNEWIDSIKERINESLLTDKRIIQEVMENNLQNEQWFLDYLDELNELSVSW